jgi:methionyl-tRNA formyltransferase
MKLSLVKTDNLMLRRVADPVTNFNDPELQKLIDAMIPAMYEYEGIGLAAPQVDHSVRLAVLVPDPNRFQDFKEKKNQAIVIINPNIERHSFGTESQEEGCLSVPGYYGPLKRFRSVVVSFQDRTGKKQTMKAAGLLAKVFQHEIDHLDGTLFIDKAERVYKVMTL